MATVKSLTRRSGGDAARRTAISLMRATVEKTDDKTKLQEVDLAMFKGEKKVKVERAQQYGYTSRPLPPKDKEKAEAFVIFPTGTRSHGVIVGLDDRRHRPRDMQEGEVALYDDQGQKVFLQRGGILVTGGDKKLPVTVVVGNAKITVADGKITQEVGGCKFEISAAGFAFTGGSVKHDGKSIDKSHVHTNVEPGPGNTGVPA